MANQLTRLFVLVRHGLVVIHMMMSSLYIDQAVFPPTCIAQQLIILLTCNHLRPWHGEQSRLLNM